MSTERTTTERLIRTFHLASGNAITSQPATFEILGGVFLDEPNPFRSYVHVKDSEGTYQVINGACIEWITYQVAPE